MIVGIGDSWSRIDKRNDVRDLTQVLQRGRARGPLKSCEKWLLAESVNNRDRKFVAAFVLCVTDVPAHPLGLDLVDCAKAIEFLPQLDIEDRAFLATPTASLPAIDPFIKALDDILRVRHKPNPARLLDLSKPLNRAKQFHAVVRGPRLAT